MQTLYMVRKPVALLGHSSSVLLQNSTSGDSPLNMTLLVDPIARNVDKLTRTPKMAVIAMAKQTCESRIGIDRPALPSSCTLIAAMCREGKLQRTWNVYGKPSRVSGSGTGWLRPLGSKSTTHTKSKPAAYGAYWCISCMLFASSSFCLLPAHVWCHRNEFQEHSLGYEQLGTQP